MERTFNHVYGKGWRQRDTRAATRALNCIITSLFSPNVWTEWAIVTFLIEVPTEIRLRMSRERKERSSKLPRQQAFDGCACADMCLVCFRFYSDSRVSILTLWSKWSCLKVLYTFVKSCAHLLQMYSVAEDDWIRQLISRFIIKEID